MSRFNALYEQFEKHVAGMLGFLPDVDPSKLVFAYRDGVYRVYEAEAIKQPGHQEVNPATSLTSLHEIWFFRDQTGLSAHVEYNPDYRPEIYVSNLGTPVLQLLVKERPQVPGLH